MAELTPEERERKLRQLEGEREGIEDAEAGMSVPVLQSTTRPLSKLQAPVKLRKTAPVEPPKTSPLTKEEALAAQLAAVERKAERDWGDDYPQEQAVARFPDAPQLPPARRMVFPDFPNMPPPAPTGTPEENARRAAILQNSGAAATDRERALMDRAYGGGPPLQEPAVPSYLTPQERMRAQTGAATTDNERKMSAAMAEASKQNAEDIRQLRNGYMWDHPRYE